MRGRRPGERLTPRNSRKNSKVAKISGTFEECISVGETWPHDTAIEFTTMAARRFPFCRSAAKPERRKHGSFWNTRTTPPVGIGRDSATSRDSRLNDLAASLCPAKSKPRRQIGFPIFIRGSRGARRLARWISSDPSPAMGRRKEEREEMSACGTYACAVDQESPRVMTTR